MSSESLPARVKPHGEPRRPTKGDVLRLESYRQKLAKGTAPLLAWAESMTDPVLGVAAYRGAASVPVAIVRRSLGSMLRRCAPEELARSADDVMQRVSVHAPAAIDTLGKIASGDFTDSEKARTQTGAAKVVLEVAGLGRGAAPAAAAPGEPTFNDGHGNFIPLRALAQAQKRAANSHSDEPIRVEAEVRPAGPDMSVHNPRSRP